LKTISDDAVVLVENHFDNVCASSLHRNIINLQVAVLHELKVNSQLVEHLVVLRQRKVEHFKLVPVGDALVLGSHHLSISLG